ncbi:hypothetical protein P9112_006944 [Eukaryota sp. TZLM1-RC]
MEKQVCNMSLRLQEKESSSTVYMNSIKTLEASLEIKGRYIDSVVDSNLRLRKELERIKAIEPKTQRDGEDGHQSLRLEYEELLNQSQHQSTKLSELNEKMDQLDGENAALKQHIQSSANLNSNQRISSSTGSPSHSHSGEINGSSTRNVLRSRIQSLKSVNSSPLSASVDGKSFSRSSNVPNSFSSQITNFPTSDKKELYFIMTVSKHKSNKELVNWGNCELYYRLDNFNEDQYFFVTFNEEQKFDVEIGPLFSNCSGTFKAKKQRLLRSKLHVGVRGVDFGGE